MLMIRLFRRIRREDDGAALAAVMGLMIVALLITALISSSVVSAYGYSSFTRAGIESRAAAEAGIAAARAGLVAGTCASSINASTHPAVGVYTSAPGTIPRYEARIYPRVGGAWASSPGCPASATVDVRVVVTGTAEAKAVTSRSARDTEKLEAVLSAPSVPTTIAARGPAVYGYNGGSFGNGGKILTENGVPIDVVFRDAGSSGTLVCDGGMAAVTNVVLANGNMRIDSGCGITGTAWAERGTVTTSGGAIVEGSIRAKDVVISNGEVRGNVHALNSVTVSGGPTLKGHFTALTANISGGTFSAGANNAMRIYGQTTISGGAFPTAVPVVTRTLNGTAKPWSGTVTVTQTYPSVPATSPWEVPPAPSVPVWIDFPYNASMWAGFVEYNMGSDCSKAKFDAAAVFFAGRPGLIDARGCTVDIVGSDQLAFTNDVAIIGYKIHFGAGAMIINNSTTEHRLWLINPDDIADGNPDGDCKGYLTLDGGFKIATSPARFTTMIYSPCALNFSQDVGLYGQVFSASSAFSGNGRLTYAAVGLPGYDLSTGLSTSTSVSEADRRVQYVRPLAN